MTTLTIQLPENEINIISDITNIVKKVGGVIEIDNDDLTEKEFTLLQESYKEALMIKSGLSKAIPASELWND